MRDRLTELLPLLMVGVIVVVFQITRGDWLQLATLQPVQVPAVSTGTPTPVAVMVARIAPTLPSRPATPAMQALDACDSRQPRFVGGIASLRAALGKSMGEPLECERADSDGNTQQRTTTGLAYYRKRVNAACFTTGWDHWALDPNLGVVQWAGNAIEPPVDATRVN